MSASGASFWREPERLVGARVQLYVPMHYNQRGAVIRIDGGRAVVRLDASAEEVTVNLPDLEVVG